MFNILTKVDKSAKTRRNLHTHTHTCNLLLSPKQIGTICFAIFSILISAPLFATDISSSASTADCKHTPLQVYSGTSNLQAGWQANTIQLHWYNGDTEIQNVPSASQSCVYDGTLTPPATIPQKTGYTFKGWRVRSCFNNFSCGLDRNFANTTPVSEDYGFISNDGTYRGITDDGHYTTVSNPYGLTENGTWVVRFNSGTVKGESMCNNVRSNTWEDTIAGAMNGTISITTEEELIQLVYGSCSSDAIKPNDAFTNASSGQYCWCKMTSWTPTGGDTCSVSSGAWVVVYMEGGYDNASDCRGHCAADCADIVDEGQGLFRIAVFGAVGNQ